MKKIKIDVQKLFDTGAHLGHQTKRWDPRITPYLYGSREGVHVFDLDKTQKALEEVLGVLTKASKDGKRIIVVGTKSQAQESVEKLGKNTGVMYVSKRWLGGTLTNIGQIKKSLTKLEDLQGKTAPKEYGNMTKFERLQMKRAMEKLETMFGGITELKEVPDLMIIVDVNRESSAVAEAKTMGVETIGFVDSNSDPYCVDWPIPMNDDSVSAIEYVLGLFETAINMGKKVVKVKAEVKKVKAKAKPKTKRKVTKSEK